MANTAPDGNGRVLTKNLIDLLNTPHCTSGQIEAVLEAAQKRGAKDVNKTAKNKETLIGENLRRAVATGAVPLSDVYELLRDSEENDSQYHFLYLVTDGSLRNSLSNFQNVGKGLFGTGWESTKDFPNFLVKPHGEEWGDFRQDGGPAGNPGWILKLYRGDDRWVVDPAQSHSTANKRVKVWVREYQREVWLVRWYPEYDLLELCLPRLGNRQEQFEARDAMWKAISSVATQDDVEEFSLTKAATHIVNDATGLDNQVHLGGPARLMSEDGGSTIMSPRSSQQGLRDAEDRREALKHYKNCEEACVFWRPTVATDAIKSDVKTILGYWAATNSILFTARNSGTAVRYVTKRFIELELQGRGA